jgi:mono/diheme cytochrome c family protein/glucose/arabinose dehydrogenase
LRAIAAIFAAGLALLSIQASPAPVDAASQAPSERDLLALLSKGADFSPKPPVTRLTPEEQAKRFLLPDGFAIEPLLADPLIQGPVGVTFDGDGRMYVLEMRSYMRDAAGSNSREPVSRISRHEDTDGDGTYDRSTVFADRLVLPRMAFPLENGVILVLETDSRDIFKYSDTDRDGVADRKELFYPNAGRVTNMEWQPGGLTWALDNWLYMTYNPYRLRIAPDGRILREETEPNGGQWWSAQDDHGKTWWVDGGGELGPVNFQVPIAYGAINLPDGLEPDFRIPWPAAPGIADMQWGMPRVRTPDGTLNHFTAASGVEIYRGHALPDDVVGDLFFGEPVGRIVRRAKVVVAEGLTQLRNAHPRSEFLRSTDPLFRPVAVHNAPDGTLIVVDMYTGIIQDAEFMTPYLRRKIEQYQLDRQHNLGRIWRVSHRSVARDPRQPRMYSQSAAELVDHLAHANGWWRDTAQKLLVLRRDGSAIPRLEAMARSHRNRLARIHALWTLEGLDALDAELCRELMNSPDPQIRVQAIRASETLYKRGDQSFASRYRALASDSDPNVVIQAMLTMNLHKISGYEPLIRATAAGSKARGVREIGRALLAPPQSLGQGAAFRDNTLSVLNLTSDERRAYHRGEATYKEICASCHGPDGSGAAMAGATDGMKLGPPLGGSARVNGHRDYTVKVLLHGLTGPLGDKQYPGGVMVPMGANTDQWIADIASYVRNSFGNRGRMVTPEQVALVRRLTAGRKAMWTSSELEASLPRPLSNQSEWKASASHNGEAAALVLDPAPGIRWTTGGVAQQPGMWFRIDLPRVTTIAEVHLETQFTGPAPQRAAGSRGRPAARGAGPNAPPAAGPVAYSLEVSSDGRTWSGPVARGPGATPTTIVVFAPVQARVIRITQTGTAVKNEQWGLADVKIFEAGK